MSVETKDPDNGHLHTDSPHFTQACGNTELGAGSHFFVLTDISIELTKGGEQAVVFYGFTSPGPLQDKARCSPGGLYNKHFSKTVGRKEPF